jgi:hypothetical protein
VKEAKTLLESGLDCGERERRKGWLFANDDGAPSVTTSQPVDLERAGFALASDAAFHTIRAAVPRVTEFCREQVRRDGDHG